MPLDRSWLEQVTRDYLERYATTEANLRRVLRRKIRRAALPEGADVARLDAEVAPLIARLVSAGAVDDAAFARSRVSSMARRGKSVPAIRRTLLAKGVRADDLEPILAELTPQARMRTVVEAARRLRIGVFDRNPETRRERRSKDLARLARRGFRYDEAARVLDLEDPAMLDELWEELP
jgi:regulatory protein